MNEALYYAVENNNINAVLAQLDAGVDVNSLAEDGSPIWFRAAVLGHATLVRSMIDRGANINARGFHDRTGLMWVSQAGNLGMVRLLLELGADPHGEDLDGETALSLADQNPWSRERYSDDVFSNIMYHDKIPTRFERWAERRRRRKIMAQLSRTGGKCYDHDPVKHLERTNRRLGRAFPHPDEGPNLFHQAKEAVEAGADVNRPGNFTCLTMAVDAAWRFNDVRWVDLMLRHGADVNARNIDGTTALQHAQSKYRFAGRLQRRIIKLLRAAGARE